MGESPERSGDDLPEDLAARLDGLSAQQLRVVVDHAQRRLRETHRSVSEQIGAGPDEEIVSVEERSEYTEVVKREPCGENCPDCPHGPYLYHVYEESHLDGRSSLHWVFLGRRYEPPLGRKSD